MPYGFIQHIENDGYSPETVDSYQKVLKQFFIYLSQTYPSGKEPHDINPSDIRNYLENQKKQKSISTINKELAILKTFFNYLWEINKVAQDPAVKIKRYQKEQLLSLEITYNEVLEILNKVLSNCSYSKLRKAAFLLASKGLKTSDFRFIKSDVKDKEDDTIDIQLKNRIITLNKEESTYFLEYYYEAMLNGSDYVFTTKQHGEEIGGPVQVMTILSHLRAISHDYLPKDSHSLTLVTIRRALAFELYSKKVPIQQIAIQLGIEEDSASSYLKQIMYHSQKELEEKIKNSV